MEQFIYGITIVIYAVFIIRFILSWVGGDFDLDMDTDGDVDLGDVVSFKGATHFLMGFFGWLSTKLMTTHTIEWYDYLIGFILGIIFVIILFYIYKFMMKLESKPTILFGKDLIGHQGTIYLRDYEDLDTGWKHYTITVNNGNGTVELSAISTKSFRTGDSIMIFDFENSYYLIK